MGSSRKIVSLFCIALTLISFFPKFGRSDLRAPHVDWADEAFALRGLNFSGGVLSKPLRIKWVRQVGAFLKPAILMGIAPNLFGTFGKPFNSRPKFFDKFSYAENFGGLDHQRMFTVSDGKIRTELWCTEEHVIGKMWPTSFYTWLILLEPSMQIIAEIPVNISNTFPVVSIRSPNMKNDNLKVRHKGYVEQSIILALEKGLIQSWSSTYSPGDNAIYMYQRMILNPLLSVEWGNPWVITLSQNNLDDYFHRLSNLKRLLIPGMDRFLRRIRYKDIYVENKNSDPYSDLATSVLGPLEKKVQALYRELDSVPETGNHFVEFAKLGRRLSEDVYPYKFQAAAPRFAPYHEELGKLWKFFESYRVVLLNTSQSIAHAA